MIYLKEYYGSRSKDMGNKDIGESFYHQTHY